MQRRRFDPWSGRSPDRGHATHPRILAWRIPWTEEPGALQSMGSHRVGNDCGYWAGTHAGPVKRIEIRAVSPEASLERSVLFTLFNTHNTHTHTHTHTHTWTASTPWNLRETQIKATRRYHLTRVKWPLSKSLQTISAGEGVETTEPPTLMPGR